MKIVCKPVNNKELLKTENNKYYYDEKTMLTSFSDNVNKLWGDKEATISYQGYGIKMKGDKEIDDSITITIYE